MKTPKKIDCQTCEARLSSLFSCLDEAAVNRLSAGSICNIYRKGQMVFHEGNRPLGLYILRLGKVKIFKTGLDGSVQIVRLAGVGNFIGYRALLGEQVYSASAEAIEDCTVCFLEKSAFYDYLREEKMLSMGFLHLLSRELREAENTVLDLAQKSVRERLAEGLLFLKEKYGVEDDGTLRASFLREEMANLIGTAKETLIRALAEFKVEGLIETSGRAIRLLDQDGLMQVAQVEY
jgi:CRP/FNR family transcriptional regulator